MVLLFVPTDLLQFNKSFSTALRHKKFSLALRPGKEVSEGVIPFMFAGVHMLPSEALRKKELESEGMQKNQEAKDL